MFFKKKEIKNNNFHTKICALLIHASKIDQNYTDEEEEIIRKTLEELGLEKENISKTIKDAKITVFFTINHNFKPQKIQQVT